MPEHTVATRVENLERKMELLEDLPQRMGAVELRLDDMREELSAIRQELRGEIRAEGAAIRSELRAEIQAGDEETRRYMRVLHEEVLSRIATIQDVRPRRRKR